MTTEKRSHSLFGHASAATFTDALAREGINLATLLGSLTAGDEAPGVLLVGSLAEGLGTAESDVDLLVLLGSRDDLVISTQDFVFTQGRIVELLRYQEGVELNLEFLFWDDLVALVNPLVDMAPALYDPSRVTSLPLLTYAELRLLHRLRTGWPLSGHTTVARWVDELLVHLLPTYVTLRNYMDFHELLEDASSALDGPPGALTHIARLAVEKALFSVLGRHGLTNPNNRWLIHLARRLDQGPSGALVARAQELFFPPRALDASGSIGYLTDVTALGDAMRELYQPDPELRRAIDYLHSSIHYVDHSG
jgi:predicted nucleotidyltransferase